VDPGGPATPVGLEDPATPVDLVDPATPVDRVDPAGRVTVVDPGDMNRVAAATVGTAVAMAPADLASRAVPVVRVGMIPVGPAVPVGMILVDQEGRLRAPNPVVRVDPERLVVPNPVARVEPGNREATDLSLGRALLGRMPMRRVRMPALLRPTAAGPALMRADRRTPVDRQWDPTTRAVATCRGATRAEAILRAEATRAVAIRRAEVTRKAELKPHLPQPFREGRCGLVVSVT